MNGRVYPSTAERLAARLDKTPGLGPRGDCWLWTGPRLPCGYVQIKHNGRSSFIHRVAYELAHGIELVSPRKGGLLVCHRCDIRHCANPDHLFLGTNTDNMQDMIAKGRKRTARQKGASNNAAKLTDRQVIGIYFDLRPATQIAAEIGVSVPLISMIKNGHRWAHITQAREGIFG